jgi:N-acetylmuramate 1-kinase
MLENSISSDSDKELFSLGGETRLNLCLQTERQDLGIKKVQKLTGDASTRQYFRLYSDSDTFVAAVYQEPFDPADHSFCAVTELFAAASLPVPRIVATSGRFAVILLEDLGDTRLQDWLDTASPEEKLTAYQESISLIVAIQAATELAIETNSSAARLAFDEPKLMWELDFFHKHFFKSYLGTKLPQTREKLLIAELREIAGELSARPRVLCHRDFHSRNLMLWEGKQYIIDHQDARMGPRSYDLASLLRDPYVTLDEDLISELYNYYIAEAQAAGGPANLAEEMSAEFELMTVQRIVKAIGTYAYQTAIMKNTVYVPYIPRAIVTVVNAAERLGRFPVLRELLTEQTITGIKGQGSGVGD